MDRKIELSDENSGTLSFFLLSHESIFHKRVWVRCQTNELWERKLNVPLRFDWFSQTIILNLFSSSSHQRLCCELWLDIIIYSQVPILIIWISAFISKSNPYKYASPASVLIPSQEFCRVLRFLSRNWETQAAHQNPTNRYIISLLFFFFFYKYEDSAELAFDDHSQCSGFQRCHSLLQWTVQGLYLPTLFHYEWMFVTGKRKSKSFMFLWFECVAFRTMLIRRRLWGRAFLLLLPRSLFRL